MRDGSGKALVPKEELGEVFGNACDNEGPWFVKGTLPVAALLLVPSSLFFLRFHRKEGCDRSLVWEVEALKKVHEEKVGFWVFRVEFRTSTIGDCCDEGGGGGHDVVPDVFWEACSEMVPRYVNPWEISISEGGGRPCQEYGGLFAGTRELVVREGVFSRGQICCVSRVR